MPLNLILKKGTARTYDLVDEVLIRLDPYEQDAIRIETVDNIVVVSHIKGETTDVVYSTPVQEP